jgi:hypothetical protein
MSAHTTRAGWQESMEPFGRCGILLALRGQVVLLFCVLRNVPSRRSGRSNFPIRPWPDRLFSCARLLATSSRSGLQRLERHPPTTPSADFCRAVKPPLDGLSRRSDTRQISRGKLSRLPCTTAGSKLRTLDGYGLRGTSSARPMLAPNIRFLSIGSHVCYTLPSDPTSRQRPLRCH